MEFKINSHSDSYDHLRAFESYLKITVVLSHRYTVKITSNLTRESTEKITINKPTRFYAEFQDAPFNVSFTTWKDH